MESRTTFQHLQENRLTEFCPFQIHESENICEYASAENYEVFLNMLRKIYVQLDMEQFFRNRIEK